MNWELTDGFEHPPNCPAEHWGLRDFAWGMSCWIVSIGTMIWPITIPSPSYLKTPELLDPITMPNQGFWVVFEVSGRNRSDGMSQDPPQSCRLVYAHPFNCRCIQHQSAPLCWWPLEAWIPIIRHGTGMGPWYQRKVIHASATSWRPSLLTLSTW